MTYIEVADYLATLGRHTGIKTPQIHEPEGLRAIGFYIIPEVWFIALESARELCLGIYEVEGLRLVGTRQIPFGDITEDTLQQLITPFLPTRENCAKQKFGPRNPGNEADLSRTEQNREGRLGGSDAESSSNNK